MAESREKRLVSISLDGAAVDVGEDTNLAAVLLASPGRRARTSVSNEPRGPLCGMGVCFECRVTVNGRPHVRACMERCTDGMIVETSPNSAIVSTLSATLPRAASNRAETADVAVIGAGPAGLAAAAAAAEVGADVVVLDENSTVGGQIWRAAHDAGAARPEVQRLRARAGRARFLAGVAVFDADADVFGADAGAPHRLDAWSARDAGTITVHARAVVLATGAYERFLPFPGWTLPGVLGIGGLQALLKGGLDVRGRRVLIAGSGPLALAVAAALIAAGARVVAVLEQAPRAALARFGLATSMQPKKAAQGLGLLVRLRGVPLRAGSWIVAVTQSGASLRVEASVAGERQNFDVDFVATGFGLVPATGLGELLGCDRGPSGLEVDRDLATTVPGIYAAGEANGIGGVDAALVEGELAGLAAARAACGAASTSASASERALAVQRRRVARHRRFTLELERAFELRPEVLALAQPDTVMCRCEDVRSAALEPFAEFRAAKLATRCGMGPCQGRVCGAALEVVRGWARETPRPPLTPVPMAAFARAEGAELPLLN